MFRIAAICLLLLALPAKAAADGAVDPSFGNGGVATIAPPPPYLTLNPSAMVLDSQGRVVITGQVDDDIRWSSGCS